MLMALLLPAISMATMGSALVRLQSQRERVEAHCDEVWEALALRFGLGFNHGYILEHHAVEREFAGKCDGFQLRLEALSDFPGHGSLTRATVHLGWAQMPALDVHTNQPYALMSVDSVLERIVTGDSLFDRCFEVRGADPIAVSEILGPRARQALLALNEVAPTARLRDGVLEWLEPGHVMEVDRLETILRRMLGAATALRMTRRALSLECGAALGGEQALP